MLYSLQCLAQLIKYILQLKHLTLNCKTKTEHKFFFCAADKCGGGGSTAELKKCGVTKTISPPAVIKQEPLDDPNASVVPDSSSDLRLQPGQPGHAKRQHHQYGGGARNVKTEFEVKQEPGWEASGEVNIFLKHASDITLNFDTNS